MSSFTYRVALFVCCCLLLRTFAGFTVFMDTIPYSPLLQTTQHSSNDGCVKNKREDCCVLRSVYCSAVVYSMSSRADELEPVGICMFCLNQGQFVLGLGPVV